MQNRSEFCGLIDQLNLKYAVEVGTREGVFASILLSSSLLKLYCVDPWEANAELLNPQNSLRIAQNRLKPFGDRVHLIRRYSVEIAKQFTPGSLDFIYIDALHDYDSVRADLEAWWPKLRVGGIFAGHDYHPEWPGVIQAVTEFAAAHKIKVELTGFVGINKEPDVEEGDKPSWWVFK